MVLGVCWFYSHYTPAEYLPSTPYHSRMPFLLNVLYDSGLGPITLDPAYFGAPPTPIYPRVWEPLRQLLPWAWSFAELFAFWAL